MATGIQTKNGKAFEYACVVALYDELTAFGGVEIEESAQLETARDLYDSVDSDMKEALDKAAKSAVRVINGLERNYGMQMEMNRYTYPYSQILQE